jgi:hypothetical protein
MNAGSRELAAMFVIDRKSHGWPSDPMRTPDALKVHPTRRAAQAAPARRRFGWRGARGARHDAWSSGGSSPRPHSGPWPPGGGRARAARRRRLCGRHLRGGRLQPDDSRCRRHPRDRDRPRPHRHRRRLRSRRSGERAAHPGRRPVFQSGRCLRCAGGERGRRHCHGRRRVVDAARPGRPRLLVPARWPARHAHGARWPDRRGRDRESVGNRSGQCDLHLRRGAQIARHRARRGRRAARGADHHHTGAGRYRRPRGSDQAQRHSSRHPDVPGAAHPGQRGTRRTAVGAGVCGTAAAARWPAGGGLVPLARRPHREELLQCARQERRRIAASARGRAACAEFRDPHQAPGGWPTTPKSPPIPARARPSCGRLLAPRRRRIRPTSCRTGRRCTPS